jgi:phytoene synthase
VRIKEWRVLFSLVSLPKMSAEDDALKDWRENVAEELFPHYAIPLQYADEFVEAKKRDRDKKSYKSFAELERHMYGTVGTVCLMATYVLGFTDKRALLYAEELGYAIALTVYLRDLEVDWKERGIMYFPADELQSFNIDIPEIFVRFMGFQASRARALYLSADEGIPLLKKSGQLPALIVSALCEGLLDKLDEVEYDVFKKKIKLSLFEKLKIISNVIRKPANRS